MASVTCIYARKSGMAENNKFLRELFPAGKARSGGPADYSPEPLSLLMVFMTFFSS